MDSYFIGYLYSNVDFNNFLDRSQKYKSIPQMIDILDFIFSSFWVWLGFMVFLYILTHFFVGVLNTIMYHKTLRKIGYPPNYSENNSAIDAIKKDESDN